MERGVTFGGFVKRKFKRAFGSEGWSPLAAGLLIGFVNVVSYVWVGKAFTVYTGFLNWGQHLYSLFGPRSVAGRFAGLRLQLGRVPVRDNFLESAQLRVPDRSDRRRLPGAQVRRLEG